MHGSIYGRSYTGKTYVAQMIAKKCRSLGYPVAVFDPHFFGETDWQCDYITANKKDFVEFFYTHIGYLCIIDEAGANFNAKDVRMCSQGRHWGHTVFLLSQRAQQVDKTMRDQCDSFGLIFRQDVDDSKALSRQFIYDDVATANELENRHCFLVNGNDKRLIKTDTEEGIKAIDKLCKTVVKQAPLPTWGLVRAVNIGGQINKNYLFDKGFYYNELFTQ